MTVFLSSGCKEISKEINIDYSNSKRKHLEQKNVLQYVKYNRIQLQNV